MARAFVSRDWEAHRKCVASDFVFHDHRALRFGLMNYDEWEASIRAAYDLAPDYGGENLRILAWNRRGRVTLSRTYGNWRDGGPWETFSVMIMLTGGDRVQRVEIFDVDADATDAALARFAELCAE